MPKNTSSVQNESMQEEKQTNTSGRRISMKAGVVHAKM